MSAWEKLHQLMEDNAIGFQRALLPADRATGSETPTDKKMVSASLPLSVEDGERQLRFSHKDLITILRALDFAGSKDTSKRDFQGASARIWAQINKRK